MKVIIIRMALLQRQHHHQDGTLTAPEASALSSWRMALLQRQKHQHHHHHHRHHQGGTLTNMQKTPSLQNGRSQLNYKLIWHRFTICIFFHAFQNSSMLSLYKKMILGSTIWHVDCLHNKSLVLQNHDKIYSLQNACSLQNSQLNITLLKLMVIIVVIIGLSCPPPNNINTLIIYQYLYDLYIYIYCIFWFSLKKIKF